MEKTIPDHTAVRVALWRVQHMELDAKPSVLADEIGIMLVSPDANWRERPDMHPQGTKGYRASISRADIISKFFYGRTDGLFPASGEEFLVATI